MKIRIKHIANLFAKSVLSLRLMWLYKFVISDLSISPQTVSVGEVVTIAGKIKNLSKKQTATAYPIILIASPFDLNKIVFNSDIHLEKVERHALRRQSIPRNEEVGFALTWRVPESILPGVLHIRIELWTPSKLFKRDDLFHPPFRHSSTPWDGFSGKGAFEIVPTHPDKIVKKPIVFISYSRGVYDHEKWVKEFAGELKRNGIDYLLDAFEIFPGDNPQEYMDTMASCDFIIPICSYDYIEKVNSPKPSGVREEVKIIENIISKKLRKIIPVIRNNPSKVRPKFIENLWYVDMDSSTWQGIELLRLIETIRERN